MVAIRCRALTKIYPGRPPVEAVRGLDLEVQAGECYGLLGPNGAGKTTTVEILEGLLDPTGGELEVLGLDWASDERELRERMGVSLQETRLADKLTVAETLALFASFYRRPRAPAEVAAEVGLAEKSGALVMALSGGQRQRLAVACALVGDPDLLFLDEPTTGLDPQSRRQLWEIVRDLRSRGRTVVLTTHYMDEAERLCDRVAIIDHGRVIAVGSPAELIASLGGEHVIELAVEPARDDGKEAPAVGELAQVPSVSAVRVEGDGYQLAVAAPHVALPRLLDLLARRGLAPSRLTTRHASLEDVFVALTGRHLRDA